MAAQTPLLVVPSMAGDDSVDGSSLRYLLGKILVEKKQEEERRKKEEKEKEEAARSSASSAPKRKRMKKKTSSSRPVRTRLLWPCHEFDGVWVFEYSWYVLASAA